MSTEKNSTFFKRLLFWKSPRSEAIFGYAWMIFTLAVMPFILLGERMIFENDTASFLNVSFVKNFMIATALLYLAGVLFCTMGLYGVLQTVFKSKWLRTASALAGAWFPPLGAILLLTVLLKQKRFAAALFALGGGVLYTLIPSGINDPFPMLFWGGICFIVALIGVEEGKKLSLQFILPLVLAVSSQIFLFCYNAKLEFDIREKEEFLMRLIGQQIGIKEFWERNDKGYPLNSEPVKSFIAAVPELNYAGDRNSALAEVERVKKEHPQFIASLDKFLQLPVCHIAHEKPKNNLLTSITMPELMALRRASSFLATKIKADPDDKTAVAAANSDLIKLRNWTLNGKFLISYLVALSIERNRLDTLSCLLVSGKYSKAEFTELVAPFDGWNQHLRYAFGDEVTMFKNAMEYLTDYFNSEHIILSKLQKFMMNFLRINFMRDYCFSLDTYIKICGQEDTLSGMEKSRRCKIDEAEISKNGYMLSAMLLPTMDILYQKSAQINDASQMAIIAAAVAEYRQKHGKLPENLDFLPEKIQSELHHQPFMYEKTSYGFRIYTNTVEDKKPSDGDSRYSYQVFL